MGFGHLGALIEGAAIAGRMLRVASIVLVTAVAACGTSQAEGQPAINAPGRVTFESLGWTEDVLITGASPPATVRFRLPEGVKQGEPLWHGVRLSYEWSGNPGNVGDFAYLYGKWNDRGLYQLQMERVTDLDAGFKWSMVDYLNGGSRGYELGPTFRGSSSNFGSFRAVQGGWNEFAMRLDLTDASNKDIKARIKKESEVFATSWQPTSIEASARADISANAIRVDVKGKNRGWHAPKLTARALVFREDGNRQSYAWNRGAVAPLASVKFHETVPNQGDSPVYSVAIELDWGSGRRVLQAWPAAPERPWYSSVPFRSAIGSMAALVVVWVWGPALVQAVRRAQTR